ncbi:MAG: VOC family protein [Bdellovibrionota bacterium]|nr:VOC family protein [Deltaproteobacteria bacterium]
MALPQICIESFHHANLVFPKGLEQEARSFYLDLLGLTEIKKPDLLQKKGGFWIQLGATQIHLSPEKNQGVQAKHTDAHIALQVQDLAITKSILEKHHFSIRDQETIPGMIRCETRDPFGNRIEFMQQVNA